MIPAIVGLAGPVLTADERDWLQAANPAGVILFGRNVVDRAQLRSLTDGLRDLLGRPNLPILIDQEGGRVARLGPPHWPRDAPSGGLRAALRGCARFGDGGGARACAGQ